MRICPNCSSKYNNDLNFCQACGAMLNAIIEKPRSAANHPPSAPKEDKTSAKILVSSKDSSVDEGAYFPAANEVNRAAFPKPPSHQCSRCGSTKMIFNTSIRDRDQGSTHDLEVFVDVEPDALIFKNRMYATLLADICGECGHAELKVKNPGGLYNHSIHSKS